MANRERTRTRIVALPSRKGIPHQTAILKRGRVAGAVSSSRQLLTRSVESPAL